MGFQREPAHFYHKTILICIAPAPIFTDEMETTLLPSSNCFIKQTSHFSTTTSIPAQLGCTTARRACSRRKTAAAAPSLQRSRSTGQILPSPSHWTAASSPAVSAQWAVGRCVWWETALLLWGMWRVFSARRTGNRGKEAGCGSGGNTAQLQRGCWMKNICVGMRVRGILREFLMIWEKEPTKQGNAGQMMNKGWLAVFGCWYSIWAALIALLVAKAGRWRLIMSIEWMILRQSSILQLSRAVAVIHLTTELFRLFAALVWLHLLLHYHHCLLLLLLFLLFLHCLPHFPLMTTPFLHFIILFLNIP